MKTAAAYIRVSTHMQEELSPDAQKRLIIDYAKSNDMLLTNEYIFIDSGISGRKAEKRPEFLRMIEQAKSKKFEVILVWKFSRFARNQEESIVYKSMLRNKCNVDVVSITENIGDDIYGGLIERIIEWMDEFYSIRLAEDVTRGMKEKALRGGFQASPALGYELKQKGGMPVIVEDQAKTVRTIYKLYTTSTMGFFEIARYINSLGLKTRNGGKFESRTVKYILQNPIYKGYIRWNYRDNSTKAVKSESEWIVKKGDFDPIIPEEIWNKANERLKKEYHPRCGKPVSVKRHWLSGIVKCSNCGASLSTSVHTDKRYGRTYINFQCYRYLKGKCDSNHHVSEKNLVPLILNALDQDMNSDYISFENISEETNVEQLNIYQSQIIKLQEKEKRIKDAYLNGIDSLEEYRDSKERLSKERTLLQGKIDELKKISISDVDMKKKIRGAYDILTNENKSLQDKQAAISSIVKKIVFDKENKVIDIYYIG